MEREIVDMMGLHFKGIEAACSSLLRRVSSRR